MSLPCVAALALAEMDSYMAAASSQYFNRVKIYLFVQEKRNETIYFFLAPLNVANLQIIIFLIELLTSDGCQGYSGYKKKLYLYM